MMAVGSRVLAAVFFISGESSGYERPPVASCDRPRRNGTALFLCRMSRLPRILGIVTLYFLVSIATLLGLYYALASPPMHLIYDASPPAGPSSIYVPGGGFSGFWFHLGFLQTMDDLHQYDYYCFSSGCLGALAALMNRTVDETAQAAFYTQSMWTSGNLSRFELVDTFFEKLLPHDDENVAARLERVLPKMKILLTTHREGHRISQPNSRQSLKDLLVKTTWVPYITGWGFLADEDDVYFDGGFSRLLHPECEHRLDLPLIWETLIHTFSPGLTRDQVQKLWEAGSQHDFAIRRNESDHEKADTQHRASRHLDDWLPSISPTRF